MLSRKGVNDLPVAGLSVRAAGVLRRLGIKTAEDLAQLSEDTLRRTPNCGAKTVNEILTWGASAGLALSPDVAAPSGSSKASRSNSEISSVAEMPVELLLKVSNFRLSVRARQALEMQGIQRVGDLVILNGSDLLDSKNCGRKTLSELKAAISSLGLTMEMQVPVWDTIDADELAKQHSAALTLIRKRIRKQLYAVDSSAGLEAEVISAITAVVKANDQPKVELWLGLDQRSPPTLQSVGEAAGVTRERIRQIVSRAQSRLQAASLEMRRLRAAIKCLEEAVILSDHAVVQLLNNEGLANGRVSVRGLLRAADLFGVANELSQERVGESEFVGLSRGRAVLKAVRRAGRRAVEKWGCSTIDEVAAEADSSQKHVVTPELVRDVMVTQPGFRWLDQDSGWFWLKDMPRNRLLNKVDKILATSPQIDLAALREGIARHYRMDGFSPPTRVLRTLCNQLEDCEVVGGEIIVDKRPRLPAKELSEHEQTMLAVFREYGPVLSYADTRQHCIDAGLNATTASIYIGNSPVLRRLTAGVYTVIGAAVSPGEVEAVSKTIMRSRRTRVSQDYGWEPDGSAVWATYKISEGMLRSGVVAVPAGIKKYITADGYDLYGRDGAKVGRIGMGDSSMWGFLPFFRRRGGDVGDYIRVTVNLSAGTATAE